MVGKFVTTFVAQKAIDPWVYGYDVVGAALSHAPPGFLPLDPFCFSPSLIKSDPNVYLFPKGYLVKGLGFRVYGEGLKVEG